MRWILRPTQEQDKRANKIYETGRYKHFSELLRQALNIGFDKIEDEMHERKNNKI